MSVNLLGTICLREIRELIFLPTLVQIVKKELENRTTLVATAVRTSYTVSPFVVLGVTGSGFTG